MIFLIIALGLALTYMAIQLQYLYYWNKTEDSSFPFDWMPAKGVSAIVIARNEAQTIATCLQGILSQSYPSHLIEIIVVDDHSSDDTVQQIFAIGDKRIQLLHLGDFPEYIHAPAFKKSAITLAVDRAKFSLIVVTDADCMYGRDWMKSIVYAFEKNEAVFQTAPVLLLPGNSMLEKMQEIEMLMYMLITGSGIRSRLHDIANGANMSFTKSAFQAVHGFDGNFNYASGDDMFLIEKIRTAFPEKISFAKSIDAMVLTKGKTNWSELLKQRVRWASKNMGLKGKTISLIWIFISVFHFTMLLFFILAIFDWIRWYPFLIMLCLKWVADFFLLQQAAGFFNRLPLLRYFIPLQLLYSWYTFRLGGYLLTGKKMDWKR